MNEPVSDDRSREERLNQIIAEYLEAEQSGHSTDRQTLIGQHSDLADELQAFFDDHDRMHALAEPLRPDTPHGVGSAPHAATLLSSPQDNPGEAADAPTIPPSTHQRLDVRTLPPTQGTAG